MLYTFNLDEQDLDRLLEWDQRHPHHFIRIVSVISLRWHDRYVVVIDVTDSERIWLGLILG